MNATLISTMSMIGTSKKTGNPYAMYQVSMLLPMTTTDLRKDTPDYSRIQQGYNVVTFSPTEHLHQKISKIAADNKLPCQVTITLEQRIGQNGQLVSDLVEAELFKTAVSKVG